MLISTNPLDKGDLFVQEQHLDRCLLSFNSQTNNPVDKIVRWLLLRVMGRDLVKEVVWSHMKRKGGGKGRRKDDWVFLQYC